VARCVRIALVLLLVPICSCGSIGPQNLVRDRFNYLDAVGDSWKQQTLLNIVRLRHGDVPVFVDVAQIVGGYRFERSVGVGAAGQFSLSASWIGTVGANERYSDRPTVIYVPMTGQDFIKRLMTPIPPEAVFFLIQAGYPADFVLRTSVDSVNGLRNRIARPGALRDADSDFLRLISLIAKLQTDGGLQTHSRIVSPTSDGSVLQLNHIGQAGAAADEAEVRRLLGIEPGQRTLRLVYGEFSEDHSQVAVLTRSMLQIMVEIAALIQVPASDDLETRVFQTDTQDSEPLMKIFSGRERPADAFVAIAYGGHWYWIDDRDIRSKSLFSFVMLLFSVSDNAGKANMPMVTIPSN